MHSGEFQGWEIAQERVADFNRETGRSRRAAEFTAHRQASPERRGVLAVAHALAAFVGFLLQVLTIGR